MIYQVDAMEHWKIYISWGKKECIFRYSSLWVLFILCTGSGCWTVSACESQFRSISIFLDDQAHHRLTEVRTPSVELLRSEIPVQATLMLRALRYNCCKVCEKQLWFEACLFYMSAQWCKEATISYHDSENCRFSAGVTWAQRIAFRLKSRTSHGLGPYEVWSLAGLGDSKLLMLRKLSDSLVYLMYQITWIVPTWLTVSRMCQTHGKQEICFKDQSAHINLCLTPSPEQSSMSTNLRVWVCVQTPGKPNS